MTITAAELRTIGNERTGRNESQDDIDKFIKSCVQDMSTRGIILEAEESESLVTGQPNYAELALLTNSFKKINALTIVDTNNVESKPLDEISWQRYKERLSINHASGKPREYARFNNTIYLWPKPDATIYPSMKISGTIYHADSTTIVFPDRFRECMTEYVLAKIQEKYLGPEHSKTKGHIVLYGDEFNKLLGDQNTKEISAVRYNDI